MKKNGLITLLVFSILVSKNVFASPLAPTQRIDIANILSNSGGVTNTPVALSFKNSDLTTCFSTILAFQGTATIFAGPGQVCISKITALTITPLASPGDLGVVYTAPDETILNHTLYYSQITIAENTAPVFDPNNGAILLPGTAKATVVAN